MSDSELQRRVLRELPEERKREEEELETMLHDHKRKQLEAYGISQEPVKIEFDMKPREVKEILDRDVIGQERAKKYLANAVCYHYARIKRDQGNGDESDTAIKKNVLMIGNTGVGKTYLVKKVSKIVGVPFVKADATKFSETGYVGGNVEDIVRNLYFAADKNIQLAQYGMIYIDEIDKIRGEGGFGRDVSGVGVQRNLLKLMEETEVDLISNADPLATMQAMTQMQLTGQTEKPVINTKNILFIVSGAFPGLEDIIERRLNGDYKRKPWHFYISTEDLVDYGFEAEFVGRLPIRVALDDLSSNDLYHILTRSGDSPVRQYQADFKTYGIDVEFSDDALRTFAKKASEESTGARALTGIFENALVDYLYELPSSDIKEFIFTGEMARNPRKGLTQLLEKR